MNTNNNNSLDGLFKTVRYTKKSNFETMSIYLVIKIKSAIAILQAAYFRISPERKTVTPPFQ